MEIRELRYFLEIAREGNMSRAADVLHVSQPTLSKQIKGLEEELGKKLFRRASAGLKLTEEGMLLRKRSEDILDMVDKTADEFACLSDITGGDVRIGCAESCQIKYLARTIKRIRQKYPLLRFHITSGGTEQVAERLDKGLFDFAVIVEPPDLSRYTYIEVPETDVWGLVMRKDDPLAYKESICAEDLIGLNVICSQQSIEGDIPRWCSEKIDSIFFAGTTNLAYNGSIFVKEGLGVMLTFDGLINTGIDSDLCFRPLSPRLENKMYLIWKKYQVFTPIAEILLDALKEDLSLTFTDESQ
ncbi:MAG: LysR family transcriptional regulator [Synergistes sp.]|nr:LysR family transcriptional regulator [Synergistes sp.]